DAAQRFILLTKTAFLVGCRNKHESVSDKTVKGIEDGYAIIIFRVRMSVLSSTCTSCSLLEFLLVSTFGGLG
ncbi:MAG TPA: hypothetical protein VEP90_17995, partial [Methylomirabilota bacterium]|nr:hypothetical protein [Methylomirabilota bacterium]